MLVRWKAPDDGWFKLNLDQSSSEEAPDAGGDMRLVQVCDHGISGYLGAGINIYVELAVVILGVRFAVDCGIRRLWVEIDAQAILHIIRTGLLGEWHM